MSTYRAPFKDFGPKFTLPENNAVGLSWAEVDSKTTGYQFAFRATLDGFSVATLPGMNPKGFIMPPYSPFEDGCFYNQSIDEIIILN